MKIYLTTDTHFNHSAMVENGWREEGYEEKLLEGFKVLKEDDILIHLGDICIGADYKVHESYFKPIPCKKWLIRGNHDRKSFTWYLNHSWDVVCRNLTLDIYGKRILLSHEPTAWGEFDVNIHGHLHDNHREYEIEQTNRHILLAEEYVDYKLIELKVALKA